MQRCLQLAAKGLGTAAPNPIVGAVLVHGERIIGEGYHHHPGGPHAEVVCINTVSEADKHLIATSTLYVSLEPCNHHGRTPPCTDLILKQGIRKVVVGCVDPFSKVAGTGIQRLRDAGVEVEVGVLERACLFANRRFFTAQTKGRPYVILKWAQTADGFIGTGTGERLLISGEQTARLVHRWRSEESAILVGNTTALLDNPSLTNRHWSGPQPLRVVLDRNGVLPNSLKLFSDGQPTLLLTEKESAIQRDQLATQTLPTNFDVAQVLEALQERQIQSVLVEGGAQVLQSFIDAGLWDEMRVIINPALFFGKGVAAPLLPGMQPHQTINIGTDVIHTFYKTEYYQP